MRGEGKKILAFLMAGTIAFGAFGCKKKNKNSNSFLKKLQILEVFIIIGIKI